MFWWLVLPQRLRHQSLNKGALAPLALSLFCLIPLSASCKQQCGRERKITDIFSMPHSLHTQPLHISSCKCVLLTKNYLYGGRRSPQSHSSLMLFLASNLAHLFGWKLHSLLFITIASLLSSEGELARGGKLLFIYFSEGDHLSYSAAVMCDG